MRRTSPARSRPASPWAALAPSRLSRPRSRPRASALLAACLLGCLTGAGAQAASASPAGAGAVPAVSVAATVEQCVTSVVQAERSATFTGEMVALAGTPRMAMRIDVEERLPHESAFHAITAPGLGVWRNSDPKVKVYKYLKQVTNLSSPAVYRGLVRYRWMNAKGHLVRHAERLTPVCRQPATLTPPPPAPTQPPPGSTQAGSSQPPA